ncbi:MAG: major capsid protein [Mesorhizobium sp.]|uniref:major capsid protein n=1 Tax=Mesorhizobium sp. TaxID=1871066 RepID=UPI000FE5EA98|nr:major capsid protein [Mesorhizobium sp.]RWF44290.1 MAG: major capsid protein [Mesorhizobium sp.]
MLDIFKSDPFSVFALTDAINTPKFVPGRIGEMGLFSPNSITTTAIGIEQKDGVLVLVEPTPRGGPGVTVDKSKSVLRYLAVPHFEIDDAIMAEEVQGIRAFGSETDLESVMGKVDERMMIHGQSMEATQEYSRIGAVKGIITYADSTTVDLFSEFGVTQEAEVDFDLDNANPAEGALRKKCATVIRLIATNLQGVPWTGKARAFCGDTFFDQLIAHPEVRATYDGWTEAQILREGYIETNGKSYGAFEFGGIIFENYRGSVGATAFIDPLKCHIFPEGVPNLFRTAYAPADYIETVNTLGKKLYMKQFTMPNDKGIRIEVQMNAMEYCTRPAVLIKGKNT